MRVTGVPAVVAVAVAVLAGCSGSEVRPPSPGAPSPSAAPSSAATTPSAPSAPPAVFPGRSWDRAESGDWTELDAELRRDGTTCVAVVKDGRLVHDASFGGGSQPPGRIYSITKSLSALLVAMQVDDGDLALDRPVAGDATLRELMAMTSGRRWSEAADRQMIRATADQTAFALAADEESPPGSRWVYDNVAAQLLEDVLDDGSPDADVAAFAEDRLLGPLGMRDTTWARDAAGNALTYSGATSTCLDLARVGHLMLNGGRWRGEQLVSADLVRQLTTSSSDLNAAYGLLWWTNASGRVVEIRRQAGFPVDRPPYEGRLAPDVPADAFWALGYGNQYVAVVPSEGVVAVRLGARPATPDRVTFDGFTAGVLDALG